MPEPSTAAGDKSLQQLRRWIFLMMQVGEASYYISRTKAVAHPHLMTSLDAILEVMGYFRGALNAYAKCFVSSGAGKITLQVSEVIVDHPERLAAHERLMQLRHKYAAHSDENEFEDAEIEIHETPTNVEVDLRYLLSFGFDRMYELDSAIRHLELHIVDRQAHHIQGVEKRLGKTIMIRQGHADLHGDDPHPGSGA